MIRRANICVRFHPRRAPTHPTLNIHRPDRHHNLITSYSHITPSSLKRLASLVNTHIVDAGLNPETRLVWLHLYI